VVPKVEALGLKILFLLIPGIIALGVIKALGPRRPRSDFEQGLQIFVYGVVSYALTGALEGIVSLRGSGWLTTTAAWAAAWSKITAPAFNLATLNPENGLDARQIVLTAGVAVGLGCVLSIFQTHSIPHRVLRKLRVTKRIGEVDIWALALNSPDLENWITVRIHDTGKVYQGWVYGYSDGNDERELLLMDVVVYALEENTGSLVEVDKVPVMYLGLDRKNVALEFQRRVRN